MARVLASAARSILELGQNKIRENGRFVLALSGGTTPRAIYAEIAKPSLQKLIDWKKVHFFWGDERWVLTSSPESNFRMAREALLSKIKIPRVNIHPVLTKTASPKASASLYQKEIQQFFKLKKGELPKFDLVLLGLGKEGHTASLFPNNAALKEKKALAVSVFRKEVMPHERITLTLPVLKNAENIFFLVGGSDKAAILKKVLHGKGNLPAQIVNRAKNVTWFLDASLQK